MIGDHVGIQRSVRFLKTLSGFYMVYFHGMTMFALLTPWLNFNHLDWGTKGLSFFKIMLTSFLPAYAGYYLREETGPYMRGHSLDARFILVGLQFFVVAVFLEAIRLIGISLSPFHIFDWSALHFIALAMLVSYVLLSIDKRIMLPFTIALMLGHQGLTAGLAGQAVPVVSVEELATLAWLWSGALAALLMWVSWRTLRFYWPIPNLQRQVILVGVFGMIVISMPFFQSLVIPHTRALTNFHNLPSAIFVTNTFDDNYWPLVLCFPLFAAGYFFRDFCFNPAHRRWFPWLLLAGVFGILHLVIVFIPTVPIGAQLTFPKFVFMTWDGMFGFAASVFMIIVGIYYWQRGRSLKRLEKWSYYSRNIVILYLVHGPVLRLATVLFPLNAIAHLGQTLHSTLIFIWFYVVASYLISLWLSHVLGLVLERLSRVRSLSKEAT